MDPWSKVDYSRIIREASMVEGKLPEVNPPSGRVPRRGLLALPILETRRRQNRCKIAKKGSVFGRIPSRRIYRLRGKPRGYQGLGAPLAWPGPRARHQGAWDPGGGPLAPTRWARHVDFLS